MTRSDDIARGALLGCLAASGLVMGAAIASVHSSRSHAAAQDAAVPIERRVEITREQLAAKRIADMIELARLEVAAKRQTGIVEPTRAAR